MGESYIDFGAVGMLLPVFGLGLLFGAFYRWMLTQRYSSTTLGMGLATAMLFGAYAFETSVTKLFGGLVLGILVSWLITRFVAPRYLPWLVR